MRCWNRVRGRDTSAALALLIFCAGLLLAEEGSPSTSWKAPPRAAAMKNPVPADDESIDTGRILYVKECASCHGGSGKGDGNEAANLSRPPADFHSPKVREQSDGELFWKITEGKKPMPRFARTLNDEQRWHAVNYIRSLAPREQQ